MRTAHGFGARLGILIAMVASVGACGGELAVEGEEDTLEQEDAVVGACDTKLAVPGVSASVVQDGNPASQAVDGNLTTRWSGFGKGAFITADLGAQKPVCSVGVAWYQGDTRTNSFTVGLSTDGTNFTQAYSGTSGMNLSLQTYPVTPASARYVRLTVNGNTVNDWASVNELEITGTTGFKHPGILSSKAQLDFVKAKIAAGAQPWTGQLQKAKSSKFGNLAYVAHPVTQMKCGNGTSSLDQGCSAAMDDALAAYTQTLIGYYTGDKAYTANAIKILNAWSSTLDVLIFDKTKISTDPDQNNGPLVSAWLAESFPRSAEILRYSDSGWAAADIQSFSDMMTGVFLPHIINGWTHANSNWVLSMANGVVNIGVFTDNKATFDKGLSLWRTRVPQNMYLTSDGPLPVAPPEYNTTAKLINSWYGQTTFVDGINQETCRDFGHTQMGIASTVAAAETARLQGVDLYGEQSTRITAALEFIAKYLNANQTTVPSWLCGGTIKLQDLPAWEIGYNHYAKRMGKSLPETATTVARTRATSKTHTNLQMAWETLTHGDVGALPLP
jgi:hypothetical protein